ncbi:MAG TPA: prephenate dehydrogenase [Streptosporangiaceae bacterium]|nr:prephenate dehydrogenase [Streptosporangiaceae bacterium]
MTVTNGPPVPAALGSAVVLGTGLIGTSIALALREHGVQVWLSDRDQGAARLAADLGAGEVLPANGAPRADIAVLAVPPAAVASSLARAQAAGLARAYTDVASVKVLPLEQARALGCDLSSFVAGHPMSGRERSGPAAARADLFLGRPWVLCPHETGDAALAAATELVRCCRASLVQASAAEHDRWVALVSHAPHVVAAAMATRLTGAPDTALALAGQGLRDVTRVAAGDAGLWAGILAANAAPVADVLAAAAADLAALAQALTEVAQAPDPGQAPSLKVVTALLEEGVAGVARIPGKHSKPRRDYAVVQVVIRDAPGELARLFQAAGEAGVNIEDLGIEHSPGLPVGVAELTVQPEDAARLTEALAAAGWPVRAGTIAG